jgi:predicted lipid-binding transport protein (Tim44 family)
MKLRRIVALVIALASTLMAAVAVARPGGGHSCGGGGGHSFGGGGGGISLGTGGLSIGGGFYTDLFILIALVILLIRVHRAIRSAANESDSNWSSMPAQQQEPDPVVDLQRALCDTDPNFSSVVFEDFLATLYTEVQHARGDHSAQKLRAYLSDGALETLSQSTADKVDNIIVGGISIHYVRVLSQIEVGVQFQTNYSEYSQGIEHAFFSEETWVLARALNAKSRPPAGARSIDCPNCGAPLSTPDNATCAYCHQYVTNGQFDWRVASITVLERSHHAAILTDYEPAPEFFPPVIERGSPIFGIEQIRTRDPAFGYEHFLVRVNEVFSELQVAWSTLQWSRARAFVSDNLFHNFSYWMNAYAAKGLRNVTEQAAIEKLELSAVSSDAHYDSITVRVTASGLDYIIDNQQKVIAGDRRTRRPYCEYWTFIRGRGVTTQDRTNPNACPQCGGQLAITAAGECQYCNAKVCSGEFDWVLSKIEQLSAYS